MKKRSFNNTYLSSLCMELGLILQAGISVNEGFLLVAEDEGDPKIKDVLMGIFGRLESGDELSLSMEQSSVFPKYMLDMIRIGENTGSLESVFKGLSLYYERQENISASIRSAVVYPVILFIMMLVVIGVLIVEVLPIFNDVFNQLGSTMSQTAMGFLMIGESIRNGRFVILTFAGVIAVVFVIIAFNKAASQKFLSALGRLMSKTNIGKEVAVARLASAMAMGLSAGLDIDASLEMAEKLNKGSAISGSISKCRNIMAGGKGFFEAIGEGELFPPLYARMLSIGIKTGTADEVMEEIAKRTEMDANYRIDRVIGKVEPILVVIMSVLVGLVLLSVMLPLMGIMSSI
ncbi:MAG: type II secretion system F family protein [Lachnospiraceae bacterium]|nr:type II secretion system F family protein [Lachnospiraceae bacterium]